MSRRAGLYLRISEDRGDDRLAVSRQREDGQALIERREWELVEEYVDNSISAKRSGRRPAFDRLMRDVESGKIDAIVVSEMPRLSRNRRDELRIVETCQPRGTIIAVVRGSDLDLSTAAGRLTADILAAAARHEIEQKSERHRRQIAQAAQAGRAHSGRRPFGYLGPEKPSLENPVGRPGGRVPDPVEAPIVEEMFTRFLAGARLGEIAQWLREIGVKTPQGHDWHAENVKTVLRNPRYAGIRGMRPVVDEASGRRSEWYVEIAPAVWPAIVGEEVWRATLERLRSAMHAPEVRRPGPPGRHLLSGIARCGVCGNPMVAGSIPNPSLRRRIETPSVRTYQCLPTKHVSRQAHLIDEYVEWNVVQRLAEPDAARWLLHPQAQIDLQAVQAEAMATRERLRGLARAYSDGAIDYDQLATGSAHMRGRLGELEAQIAAAGQVDVLAPLVLAESIEAAGRMWDGLPMSTKRAIVSRLFVVTIHRGRIGRPPAGLAFDPESVSIEPNLAGGGPSPSGQPEPSS